MRPCLNRHRTSHPRSSAREMIGPLAKVAASLAGIDCEILANHGERLPRHWGLRSDVDETPCTVHEPGCSPSQCKGHSALDGRHPARCQQGGRGVLERRGVAPSRKNHMTAYDFLLKTNLGQIAILVKQCDYHGIMTNRMSELRAEENLLGSYLKDRRTKLDPATFGFSAERRRTPGLRREEVAQLANISPTWYTWLEQGRGGAPSADVLDRIARALMLTDVEREHLFLLGLGRPPEVRYRKNDGVTPRLQRVLDALDPNPALIRTATWDVIAWNRAATEFLIDPESLPPEERNILRFIFLDPRARVAQYDWQSVARFVLGAFRIDAARAGAAAEVEPLVDELCRLSPEFKAMWRENEVRGWHGEAVKRIRHPVLGSLAFEYSAFWVDGRTDLTMVVYNPATPTDADKIKSLMEAR
jgi:transcriptional regulator with XRE-family HTH domain